MNSESPAVADETFLEDVLAGLAKRQKQLPCKYFYDQRGSKLFDEICDLEEYYLTRTEQWIMNQYAPDMAQQLGKGVCLVELGSGSSIKTEVLLNALIDPAGYVPVDISRSHLLETAQRLRVKFPAIEILPVVADFTGHFEIPSTARKASHNAVYFPGSTIGNFEPEAAQSLLAGMSRLLGPQGGLLIGIDLQKAPAVIEAAYNDRDGITAEFNRNILHRANRELGSDFDVESFAHVASYSEEHGRVEIFLESTREQSVRVAGTRFDFGEGERIHTEYSHKYTIDGFAEMAGHNGFVLHQSWTDPNGLFGVLHLVLERTSS